MYRYLVFQSGWKAAWLSCAEKDGRTEDGEGSKEVEEEKSPEETSKRQSASSNI